MSGEAEVKFRVEEVKDPTVWNQLVADSEQGTFFSRYEYLEAVGLTFHVRLVYKANALVAGIVVLESANGENCVLDDLVVYGGILFGKPDHKQKYYGILHDQHEVSVFIIEYLTNRYRSVEFALSPAVRDMRPFLWHNYGAEDAAKRFQVDIRYTSYLDISELSNDGDEESTKLFMDLERLRKKNIRRARKENSVVEETSNVAQLIDLYRGMMGRQGVKVTTEKLSRIEGAIQRMLDMKLARMFLSRDQDSAAGTIHVLGLDEKRAYSWYMAGDSDARSNYTGTMVFWDSFKHLRESGISEVDLEGVNSPHRGRFKLSFGGLLVPYHEVSLGG